MCVFKSGFSFPVFWCHSLVKRGALQFALVRSSSRPGFSTDPRLTPSHSSSRWRERGNVGICALKRGVDDEEKAVTVPPTCSEGSSIWIWVGILQPRCQGHLVRVFKFCFCFMSFAYSCLIRLLAPHQKLGFEGRHPLSLDLAATDSEAKDI